MIEVTCKLKYVMREAYSLFSTAHVAEYAQFLLLIYSHSPALAGIRPGFTLYTAYAVFKTFSASWLECKNHYKQFTFMLYKSINKIFLKREQSMSSITSGFLSV